MLLGRSLLLALAIFSVAIGSRVARADGDEFDDLVSGMKQMFHETAQRMRAHRTVTIVGAAANAALPSSGKVNARVGAVSASEVDPSAPRGEVPCDDLEKIHETRRTDAARYYSWSSLTPAIQRALRDAGGAGFRQPAEVEFASQFFELCKAKAELISMLDDDEDGDAGSAGAAPEAPQEPAVIDFSKPEKPKANPLPKPKPKPRPTQHPTATMRTIERPSGIEIQVTPVLP